MVNAEKIDAAAASSEMDDVPGSSAGTANREQDLERAGVLFTAGKHDYIAGKYDAAVGSLTDACELYDSTLGGMTEDVRAFRCRFYYGKVLLELARMESTVFNNALDVKEGGVVGIVEDGEQNGGDADQNGGDAEQNGDDAEKQKEGADAEVEQQDGADDIVDGPPMTDEEKAEVHEEVERAMEEAPERDDDKDKASTEDKKEATDKTDESAVEQTSDDAAAKTEADSSTGKEPDSKPEEGAAESTEAADADEQKGGDNEEGEEGDNEEGEDEENDGDGTANEDDQPSNLQLAFETLDLCRVIAEKQTDKEWRERLFETLLVLGEVGQLNETIEEAVGDLRRCIEVQKEVLEADDRRIAEAYYQLGKCHLMKGEYDEAIAAFTSAKDVINSRKDRLSSEGDASTKEVEELAALLPEIQSQINDCVESKSNEQLVKDAEEKENGLNGDSAEDKPVSDVTNLIKKPAKRVSTVADGDGEPAAEESAAKRAKVDSAVDADPPTNGHAAGTDQVGVFVAD